MKKRVLSLAMVGVLLLSIVPLRVSAAETAGRLSGIVLDGCTVYNADEKGVSTGKEVSVTMEGPHFAVTVQGTEAVMKASASDDSDQGTSYYLRWCTEKKGWSGPYTDFFKTAIYQTDGDKVHIQVADDQDFTNAKDYYLWITWAPATQIPTEGYRVALSAAAETATVDEIIPVTLNVTHATETTYNAYHYELTYDSSLLEYVSVSGDAKGEDSGGKLTVLGYGKDKNCGGSAVVVNFSAKDEGNAAIRLTSARVDSAANAVEQDAPEAHILQDTVTVSIVGYTVQLPDDLSGATTVSKHQDYTFTEKNPHYDYTITATMHGAAVEVLDNGDGSYTIKNVTGNLEIFVEKTPKSYPVKLESIGAFYLMEGEVEFAGEATYGTDYTFTVHKDDKSVYVYQIKAFVGDTELVFKDVTENTYTIAGTDLTGPITIRVDKSLSTTENARLTFTGSGCGDVVLQDSGFAVSGGVYQVSPGKEVFFSLREEENYAYTVLLNGMPMTAEAGLYRIPGETFVAGSAVTVTVQKVLTLQNVTITAFLPAENGTVYHICMTIRTAAGKTLLYDTQPMYLLTAGEGLSTYVYLVEAAEELTEEAVRPHITLTSGTAGDLTAGGKDAYDVNATGAVDINDAQLVYDIYNRVHNFTADRMSRFLRADVNRNGSVDVDDSAAIVDRILHRGTAS